MMNKSLPGADTSTDHSKAERVHRELRRRIRELELQPGSRLHKNEIALEFGVSRAPVSEAIAWLAEEGLVDVVINTPEGQVTATLRDGFQIRRAAAEKRIPCLTSIDTARAAVDALVGGQRHFTVQPLREYLGA